MIGWKHILNMRRCQVLVRKYILRSNSMIPNSYAIKPENLTSPLSKECTTYVLQGNFAKSAIGINIIAIHVKGEGKFIVIILRFPKCGFVKLLSIIQHLLQP